MRNLLGFLIAAAGILMATAASAHTGSGDTGGFLSGVAHPMLGWDHVIAMVAVGLWAAFLGRPAIYILPIVFALVMAFGGALAFMRPGMPMVETGIAASGVVLGLLVAFAVRDSLAIAMAPVAVFAVFHGYAHGAELPQAASPFAYAVGVVIATCLLYIIGIGAGFLTLKPRGTLTIRAIGGAIALAGASFLFGFA